MPRLFLCCLVSSLTTAQLALGQEPPDELPPPPPPPSQAPPPPTYNQPAPPPQAPATPAPETPAPAPQAPATEGAQSSPDAATDEEQCAPPCRAGFTCLQGRCVEACNPPCAAGEQCAEGGRCIAMAPAQTSSGPVPAPFFPQGDDYQRPPPPSGHETHDGFMLRLTLGFGGGGASWEVDDGGDTTEVGLDGFAASFSLDIGGALGENLVLHGRLADFVVSDPTLRVDDEELTTLEDESFGFILIGPAITYYFMPTNLYLTGAIGLSFGGGDDSRRDDETTDAGWGLNLDIGKEWWVGSDWGLGVAGRLWFSNVPDRTLGGDDIDIAFTAFGVLFSATYQ